VTIRHPSTAGDRRPAGRRTRSSLFGGGWRPGPVRALRRPRSAHAGGRCSALGVRPGVAPRPPSFYGVSRVSSPLQGLAPPCFLRQRVACLWRCGRNRPRKPARSQALAARCSRPRRSRAGLARPAYRADGSAWWRSRPCGRFIPHRLCVVTSACWCTWPSSLSAGVDDHQRRVRATPAPHLPLSLLFASTWPASASPATPLLLRPGGRRGARVAAQHALVCAPAAPGGFWGAYRAQRRLDRAGLQRGAHVLRAHRIVASCWPVLARCVLRRAPSSRPSTRPGCSRPRRPRAGPEPC